MKKISTLEELNEIIDNNDKVVIDFYADWCGPCKKISPEIEKLEKQVSEVVFVKVNVEENEEATERFLVTSLPTFFFCVKGKIVNSVNGASIDKFKDALNNMLSPV